MTVLRPVLCITDRKTTASYIWLTHVMTHIFVQYVKFLNVFTVIQIGI
jgi:hypothetical protein